MSEMSDVEIGRSMEGHTYVGGPGACGMWVDSKNLLIAKRMVAAMKRAGKDWGCAHKNGCVCEAMEVLPILEQALRVCARRMTLQKRRQK